MSENKEIGVSSASELFRFATEVRQSRWLSHKGEEKIYTPLNEMTREHLQKVLSILRKEEVTNRRRVYWEWRISFELQYRIHMGERVVDEFKEALPALRNADEVAAPTAAETAEAATA